MEKKKIKLTVRKISAVRGLCFRKRPKCPVLIKLDGYGIHTWFVFFSIRAVFLDKDCKIIDIRWRLRPFTIYKPRQPPAFVIESDIDDPWLPVLGKRIDLEVANL